MITKIKQFTSLVALLAIGLGVFPLAAFGQKNQAPNFDISAQARIKIIVLKAPSVSVIIPNDNLPQSSVSFSCIGGVASAQTFVQTQAAVNLNQPADCFNLSVAKSYQAQFSLSVRPLFRTAQRVVVLPEARISGVYYHHAPIYPPEAPVIPALAALMVFSCLALGVMISKLKKIPIDRIKQTLTLQQLQVMRC